MPDLEQEQEGQQGQLLVEIFDSAPVSKLANNRVQGPQLARGKNAASNLQSLASKLNQMSL